MLREALKSWRRSPWLAITLTAILAAGIGGASGVLALRNRVLLHPLPLPNPRNLVLLEGAASPPNGQSPVAWYSQAPALASLCEYATTGAAFVASGRGGFAYLALVSRGFFAVAGVRPVVGRGFSPAEQRAGAPVAVVSHQFWRQEMGGGAIAGQTVKLSGRAFSVIGVMPTGFSFPARTAVWIPEKATVLPVGPSEPGLPFGFEEQNLIGHLRPGFTVRQASAQVNGLLHRAFPGAAYARGRAGVAPLHLVWSNGFGSALAILLIAAGFLWFIACADAGWILLVRTVAGRREAAVRVALGAGQGSLLGRAVAECFWLVLWAAAGGLAVAMALIAAARHWGPAAMPGLERPLLGLTAMYVAGLAVISLLILCALCSAVLLRGQVVAALQQQPLRGSRLLPHTWAILVAAQIGATLVLAGGAGVLLLSLHRLTSVPLGFSPRGVISVQYAMPGVVSQLRKAEAAPATPPGKPAAAQASAAHSPCALGMPCGKAVDQATAAAWRGGEAVLAAAGRQPGIGAVALSSAPPLLGQVGYLYLAPPGAPQAGAEAVVSTIAGEYFRLLRIPLIRGRYFSARDALGAPPVAIVSAAFARSLWGGANPLGRQIQVGNETVPRTVIGVVAAIHAQGAAGPAMALGQIYCPFAQPYAAMPQWRMTLLARPAHGAEIASGELRQKLSTLPGIVPLQGVSISAAATALLTPAAFWALMAAGAAILAGFLSWLGVLGLFSHWAEQHRHEIGIRMALGATADKILGAVGERAAIVTVAGVVLGLVGGFAEAGILAHLLFGVRSLDGRVWAAAAVLLALAVAVAAAIPGWRVAHLDPARELRRE